MARKAGGRGRGAVLLALALLAGCAGLPGLRERSADDSSEAADGLGLRFEDVLVAGAYRREGLARVDADKADGFWAVVPGLARPERARVENLENGTIVDVALFRGSAAGGIRLSRAAAEALGIGAEPAPVRVTALRSVPRIATP